MTVVDVNTGKFTGSGGNLEETVTKNNLEAAEEIVRQLRLRDIGGIIVVDFIDMVLESNRDLVLRRLVECLGRDRTRHQVAEVTSLGLVQMTRKRIGTGLVEAFSENCAHCQGRGVVIHDAPGRAEGRRRRRAASRRRRWRRRSAAAAVAAAAAAARTTSGGRQRPAAAAAAAARRPSPKDVAAMARPENAEDASRASADAASRTSPAAEPRPRSTEVVEPPVETAPSRPAEVAETAPEPRSSRARGAPSRAAAQGRRPAAAGAAPAGPRPSQPVVGAGRARRPTPEPEPVVAEPRAGRRRPSAAAGAARRSSPAPVAAAPSRPAGPPVEVPGRAGTADAERRATADEDEHPHVEHVPIKKKGTRKR